MGILSWIVVGAIAGWLAGMLVKGDESLGFIGHIVNRYRDRTSIIVVVAWSALRGRTRTGRGAI